MGVKRPKNLAVSDSGVKALLEHYRCPVPFHVVRTRFLGALAAPEPAPSPLESVKELWGGELPEFDSIEAANELLQALVMGLWNRLARYQTSRRDPFRLVVIPLPHTREALADYARIRCEEIDGFFQGLLGTRTEPPLDGRTAQALDALAEARGLQAGIRELAESHSKPVNTAEIPTLHRNLSGLRAIVEREMHAALLASVRVRRAALGDLMPEGVLRH